MNISDFRALVEQRRSIRGYDETEKFQRNLSPRFLTRARWAPLAATASPEFIVVRNKQTRHQIRWTIGLSN